MLDSPVNNAMAHYLHNLFFLLGSAPDRSAEPSDVAGEVYRAKPIETFDTAALRFTARRDEAAEDVELLFYVSHSVGRDVGPSFALECTGCEVRCAGPGQPIEAQLRDGRRLTYPHPDVTSQTRKLRAAMEAVLALREGDAERGAAEDLLPCGLEAARSHTVAVNRLHEALDRAGGAAEIPEAFILREGEADHHLIRIDGLEEILLEAYEAWCLPSEMRDRAPVWRKAKWIGDLEA